VTDISVKIGKLRLKNPVMVASGTYGYEYADFVDVSKLGGIVAKSITLNPKQGNPPPRIYETPCGMLNTIGLENVGVEGFLKKKLPKFKKLRTKIIASIAGSTVDEYPKVVRRLERSGIDGIEINISCPNVNEGGMLFGQDPKTAYSVISSVRKVTKLPLIAKLTPNVGDISIIAKAVVEAGCDAISVINTIVGMAVDIEDRRPVLSMITGGLSGPAIKPIALHYVYSLYREVKVPIIGVGGIATAKDALEFIITGATAVQVGTANFINPKVSIEIVDGIKKYCVEKAVKKIGELVGSLKL